MKACLLVSASSLALLTGCASGINAKELPSQLTGGALNPSCVIGCVAEVVVTTTTEDIKSEGGGAITAQTTTQESISGPSLGMGTSETGAANPQPLPAAPAPIPQPPPQPQGPDV